MDIGSIFLILGLLILVGMFIARPLIEQTTSALTHEEHELSSLLAERDRLINALQELDFDYTLGKIPEADYPAQRAGMLQKGAKVLRLLESYQVSGVNGENVDESIEAAIAARRADTGTAPAVTVPDMAAPTVAAPTVAAPTVAAQNLAGNGSGNRLKSATAAVAQDDELETMIANRRRGRQGKSAGFCPQCGDPVQKSDRFCPKCGARQV